jgi:hypothetical protein
MADAVPQKDYIPRTQRYFMDSHSVNEPQALAETKAMSEYLASKGQSDDIRVGLWAKFIELHMRRTPEQVEALEREQGLR